ncbi:MAG: hypothetical protein OXC31_20795, partial [Spirochaetaceae bacterium]|nr:hypothetical protein [Spirochaetaceae bacterium]
FQLDNGKTLSICSRHDNEAEVSTYTYFFRHLGSEPEFRYSGRVLARLGGPSFRVEGPGSSVLSALVGMAGDEEARAVLVKFSDAPGTEGFIVLRDSTGYFSSGCYIFRSGGWQYEVCSTTGRTLDAQADTEEYEKLATYADYWLTLRSPDGKVYTFRQEIGESPFQG